jgi:hypothetical protein
MTGIKINHYLIIIFCAITFELFGQNVNYKCFNQFTYDDASVLKTPVSNKDLILLGNSHGVAGDFSIELIKYLNRTSGVRHVLVERSYADAYLINLYLQTGDLEFMNYDPEWSSDMKYFIEGIYRFNQNLRPDKKIEFLGIDGVRAITPVVLAIQKMMPENKEPNPLIKKFIDSLKRVDIPIKKTKAFKSAQQRLEEIESMILIFGKEVYRNEVYYQEFFGDNFVHVQHIVSNVATLKKQNRNSDMYQNSLRIIKQLSINEPMFGVFGSSHVAAKSKKNLAGLFQHEKMSPFKDNVIRICVAYTNCQSAFEYNGNDEAVSIGIRSIDRLRFFTKISCNDFFMEVPKNKEFGRLSDMYDYIIHVQNRSAIQFLK